MHEGNLSSLPINSNELTWRHSVPWVVPPFACYCLWRLVSCCKTLWVTVTAQKIMNAVSHIKLLCPCLSRSPLFPFGKLWISFPVPESLHLAAFLNYMIIWFLIVPLSHLGAESTGFELVCPKITCRSCMCSYAVLYSYYASQQTISGSSRCETAGRWL